MGHHYIEDQRTCRKVYLIRLQGLFYVQNINFHTFTQRVNGPFWIRPRIPLTFLGAVPSIIFILTRVDFGLCCEMFVPVPTGFGPVWWYISVSMGWDLNTHDTRMESAFKKEKFKNMAIKSSVALRFRKYARKLGKSQSMALYLMMEFFDRHGISPEQRFGETMEGLTYFIKRRFNAMIAIMRSIEKEQTRPTIGILQALFDQELEAGEAWEGDLGPLGHDLVEIEVPGEGGDLPGETKVPTIRYERLEEKLESLKMDFALVLDKVKVSSTPFGKDYLRLDMEPQEIEKYKRKIKNL